MTNLTSKIYLRDLSSSFNFNSFEIFNFSSSSLSLSLSSSSSSSSLSFNFKGNSFYFLFKNILIFYIKTNLFKIEKIFKFKLKKKRNSSSSFSSLSSSLSSFSKTSQNTSSKTPQSTLQNTLQNNSYTSSNTSSSKSNHNNINYNNKEEEEEWYNDINNLHICWSCNERYVLLSYYYYNINQTQIIILNLEDILIQNNKERHSKEINNNCILFSISIPSKISSISFLPGLNSFIWSTFTNPSDLFIISLSKPTITLTQLIPNISHLTFDNNLPFQEYQSSNISILSSSPNNSNENENENQDQKQNQDKNDDYLFDTHFIDSSFNSIFSDNKSECQITILSIFTPSKVLSETYHQKYVYDRLSLPIPTLISELEFENINDLIYIIYFIQSPSKDSSSIIKYNYNYYLVALNSSLNIHSSTLLESYSSVDFIDISSKLILSSLFSSIHINISPFYDSLLISLPSLESIILSTTNTFNVKLFIISILSMIKNDTFSKPSLLFKTISFPKLTSLPYSVHISGCGFFNELFDHNINPIYPYQITFCIASTTVTSFECNFIGVHTIIFNTYPFNFENNLLPIESYSLQHTPSDNFLCYSVSNSPFTSLYVGILPKYNSKTNIITYHLISKEKNSTICVSDYPGSMYPPGFVVLNQISIHKEQEDECDIYYPSDFEDDNDEDNNDGVDEDEEGMITNINSESYVDIWGFEDDEMLIEKEKVIPNYYFGLGSKEKENMKKDRLERDKKYEKLIELGTYFEECWKIKNGWTSENLRPLIEMIDFESDTSNSKVEDDKRDLFPLKRISNQDVPVSNNSVGLMRSVPEDILLGEYLSRINKIKQENKEMKLINQNQKYINENLEKIKNEFEIHKRDAAVRRDQKKRQREAAALEASRSELASIVSPNNPLQIEQSQPLSQSQLEFQLNSKPVHHFQPHLSSSTSSQQPSIESQPQSISLSSSPISSRITPTENNLNTISEKENLEEVHYITIEIPSDNENEVEKIDEEINIIVQKDVEGNRILNENEIIK